MRHASKSEYVAGTNEDNLAKIKFNRNDSLIDSLMNKSKKFGETAKLKTMEMQRKLEESKIQEVVAQRSSLLLNKGIEMSAEIYVKTSMKLNQLNVSAVEYIDFYRRIKNSRRSKNQQ